ncbi:hypothetical protein ACOSQ2_009324 [Xanthoceras sorbifolium]
MRGAKQQAQTVGPGEAYERHRSRPKIWPRWIRVGGPGRSGQEAQADPSRRPRRSGQKAQVDPGDPGRWSPGAQVRFREIRGDDPDEEPRWGSGRSGAMTPMRSPGAVPGDPGG